MEPVQQQEPWVFFRTSQCVSGIPMVTTHYRELERKGLVSDKNRMRVVEQIGNIKHITLAVWPKEETPKHQPGPGNCYSTYLTSTQAKVSYAGLRGEPEPSEGDEGFLYLVAYNDNHKVYKWGFFRVARVLIDPAARDYLKYTLLIEKINYAPRPPTPSPPKPATPKRKSPVREEGTSSAGNKKKKQSHDNLTQLKLPF
jgi:hypothetical protein